ncbi:MAG: leucine-rich repeat domain-containing protein [Candidatus Gracilibacteria bacterium]
MIKSLSRSLCLLAGFLASVFINTSVFALDTPSVAQPINSQINAPIAGLFSGAINVCPSDSVSMGYTLTGGVYKLKCITIDEIRTKLNMTTYPLGCAPDKVAYGITGENNVLLCKAPRNPGDCGLNDAQASELNRLSREVRNWDKFKWCNATTLDISDRGISSLPTGVYRLKNLVTLNVSRNSLLSLSGTTRQSIGRLINLETLTLHHNLLTTLPDDFGALKKLKPQLDLSYNRFSTLPESIGELTQITSIDLKNNNTNNTGYWYYSYTGGSADWLSAIPTYCQPYGTFTKLPDSIKNLKNLESFDARCSGIQDLTEGFGELTKISNLQLTYNRLAKLPQNIGNLSLLSGSFNASYNYIDSIPDSFGNLNLSGTLDFSSNRIASMSGSIGKLTNIQILYLQNNKLSSLPSGIGDMSNLLILDLTNNRLTGFPDDFGKLPKLYTLIAPSQNGQLSRINEASFSGLPSLSTLTLQNNNLEALPESLGNLPNLAYIDLANNYLRTFPNTFGNLKKLRNLNATNQNGKLTQLGEHFGDHLGEMSSYELSTINLSQNNLKSLPDSFGSIRGFSTIYLTNNPLESLPDIFDSSIKNSLTILDISNNRLQKFPDSFTKLSKLSYLYASNTGTLTSLPGAFGDLQSLYYLDISGHDIHALPDSFGSLKNLSVFNASSLGSGRGLTQLPDAFGLSAGGGLMKLTTLNLSNNNLSTLPDTFGASSTGGLKSLTTLNLSNNKLTSFPETFTTLFAAPIYVNNSYCDFYYGCYSYSTLQSFTVNLANNKLKTLPDSIVTLSNKLSNLNLSGNNQLKSLASNWQKGVYYASSSSNESDMTPDGSPVKITHSPNAITIEVGLLACELKRSEVRKLNELTGETRTADGWCTGTGAINLSSGSLTNANISTTGIQKLRGVTDLNLSYNQFTHLPELPRSVTKINLSHNFLEVRNSYYDSYFMGIQAVGCWNSGMTEIDLSYNRITTIAGGFWALNGLGGWQACSFPSLKKLNLAHNNITRISQSLTNTNYGGYYGHYYDTYDRLNPRIHSIDYSFNNISHIPDQLTKYTNLYYFDLSSNTGLKNLSRLFESSGSLYAEQTGSVWRNNSPYPTIGRPNELMSIRSAGDGTPLQIGFGKTSDNECGLTESEIKTVNTFLTSNAYGYYGNDDAYGPRELCALTSVTIRHNKAIPDAFWKLKNLMSLSFADAGLTALPEGIGNLKKLQTLNLDNNSIGNLPASFSGLTELVTLSYRNNRITTFPEVITSLPKLNNLQMGGDGLSRSAFTSLPTSFSQLTSLIYLDLSYGSLRELPSDFEKLVNLNTLSLNNNQLTRLPERFGQLSQLISLNLTNNQLVSLSPDFGNLHLTGYLDLSINKLTNLPSSIGLLNVSSMILSYNDLESLPLGFGDNISLTTLTIVDNRAPLTLSPDFGNLANLTTLIITNSKLLGFPSTLTVPLSGLKRLTTIDFSSNQISSLPDSFGGMESLATLTINNNIVPLTLSPDFGKLANLVTLTITNSKLLGFPSTLTAPLSGLKKLAVINFSNNQISSLPDSFGGMEKLTTLNINRNNLTTLPNAFTGFTSLTTLNLQYNQLDNLGSGFLSDRKGTAINVCPPQPPADRIWVTYPYVLTDEYWAWANCAYGFLVDTTPSVSIYLNNNKLTRLPDHFGDIKINEFMLYDNDLKTLPDSFYKLNRTTIDLHNNTLSRLPDTFSKMSSLQVLNLSDNALTDLPSNFGDLGSLRTLDLSNNAIARLPSSFGELTSLTDLNLFNNSLGAGADNPNPLPESFGKLRSLQTLDLGEQGTTLKRLPASFSGLTSLQSLQLFHVGLEQLPDSIGDMTGIKTVDVRKNNLLSLPESISRMTLLTRLQAGNNPNLTQLPSNFVDLTNRLYQIDLSNTGLGGLSKNFNSDNAGMNGSQDNVTSDSKKITIRSNGGTFSITKE